MKKCTKCNSIITDDAVFCTSCGAKFETAPVQPAPVTTSATQTGPMKTQANVPQTNVPEIKTDELPSPVIDNTPNKARDKKFIILAGITIASLLIAAGAVTFAIVNANSVKKETTSEQKPSSDGGSDGTVAASGVKAPIGKYEVTIPGDYMYELSDEGDLVLGDETGNEWAIAIHYYDDLAYSLVKSKINELAIKMTSEAGYTATDSGIETVSGEEVPYIDAAKGDAKATYAFFKADDLHVFEAILIDSANVHNHDLMKNAQKVLKTAKKKLSNKAIGGDSGSAFKSIEDFAESKLK